jgi:hypothetical protein
MITRVSSVPESCPPLLRRLFHPHIDFFALIGLASRPPGEFEAAVRGVAPAVEVETVEPGRRLTL